LWNAACARNRHGGARRVRKGLTKDENAAAEAMARAQQESAGLGGRRFGKIRK
jgi:hypothetical protein